MSYRVYTKEFQLTNASTELALGLGVNEALMVSSATIVNYDTVARLLTMNLASTGAAAGNDNLIEFQKTLTQKQSSSTALSGKTIMPGAKIYANADATNVTTLSISGTIVPQS
jgi:hypothetical protein